MIFFVVEGLIVWTVIRYRRKPGDDELPPQTHGNNLAEITWTVVPTLIVIFLFVISWQTLNTVEATSIAARTSRSGSIAGQFQWTFDYLPPTPRPTRPGVFTVNAAAGPGRRPVPAGRQDDPPLPDEQRRHPRVLRPAVPVQARRRPGRSSNQFDLDIQASDAGQTYPRPVRRAVRHRPRHHALRGPCPRRRPTSRRLV